MLSFSFRRFAEKAAENVAETVAEGVAEEIVRQSLPGVSRIILTSGLKGGVGKSTVAYNTAVALAKQGARVGLYDANIYSPSLPILAGSENSRLVSDKETNFYPINVNGVETVSVGNIVPKGTAVMWKGPEVGYIICDFMRRAIWPELDYLIIDTPPTTGDVMTALATMFKVDAALIVTDPTKIARESSGRTVNMFQNIGVPILGVVENMSGFKCDACNNSSKILPDESSKSLLDKFHLELLGKIPVDPKIAKANVSGKAAVFEVPDSVFAKSINSIAKTIISRLPKIKPEEPARVVENPPPKPAPIVNI